MLKKMLSPRRSSDAGERGDSSSAQPAGRLQPDGSFVCPLGSLTTAEVVLARENFSKFDVDGDGVISRADFGAAMARYDPSWRDEERRAQLDAMFMAVDLDGSGRVAFDKFAVMRVRKKVTAAAKKAAAAGVATQMREAQATSRTEMTRDVVASGSWQTPRPAAAASPRPTSASPRASPSPRHEVCGTDTVQC
jgi:hypothetical protein